jgi:Cd2+/Zn2+-exporting ATPase
MQLKIPRHGLRGGDRGPLAVAAGLAAQALWGADKVKAIAELVDRHGHVGTIGDGVNDAPAMARATVSVAMGAAGSDAAIEAADIALMADDLGRSPGWSGTPGGRCG